MLWQSAGYRVSHIVRKRIEQFFGWGKTVGGLRKPGLRGVRRNKQLMCLTPNVVNRHLSIARVSSLLSPR
jgi:hypothetical protein